ncbi:MAG: carbonic anhydrase [Acidobacteria bacterium]|nr:carbonic anhydrase [Acidobacteriota bacterium]
MRTQTKEIQQGLTPEQAFDILKEGNARFISNLRLNRNLLQQVNETSDGQHPFAIVLSCIDSRTSVELIFDQGLGDIFSVRVAGNVLNEDILGSMEFACQLAGAKLIVVLGHTRCGAVKGACGHVQMGHLTGLLGKISPAVYEVERMGGADLPEAERVERVALENTRHQMRAILDRSPILEHLFNEGKVGIVGGIYAVESGEVTFFDHRFHARPEAAEPAAAAR